MIFFLRELYWNQIHNKKQKINIMEKVVIIKPEIKTDEKILDKIREKTKYQEDKQVIVHCKFYGNGRTRIRIWASTFLIDNHSGHTSKLLTAYNIPFYPVWKNVAKGETVNFTLIFAGLPKSCETFDLYEEIPQSGGFFKNNIKRNQSDVYTITLC
jgi:hypothetical protein